MHYRPVRGSDINMKCQKLVAAIVLSGIVAINQAYAATPDKEASVLRPTKAVASAAHKKSRTDYLLLVNKTHKLPDDYEAKLDLVTVKNCFGKEFQVERETYAHFTELQADLLKEGIQIELESTYRSVARQKELTEELRLSEGEDYVKNYVAVPGYSEHHTGLALDVTIVKNGKTTDDYYGTTETPYQIMHRYLANHGFILRYPPGKTTITGYTYESWHCRYVGKDAAQKIFRQNLTLEEYLSDSAAQSLKGPLGSARYWIKRNRAGKQSAKLIREAFGYLGQICDKGEFAGENGSARFVKKVSKQCGLKLPLTPDDAAVIPLTRQSRQEKLGFLKNLDPGSVLYTKNHAMLYLGMDESKKPCVIHVSDTRWFPMEGEGPEGDNTTALQYYTRRIVAEDLFFYDTRDRQDIDSLIGAFPINRR